LLSELYEVFRRKISADEPPAKAAAEAVVMEDARFRSIEGKFDALSHTMDQRFGAFGHTMDQRFDALSQRSDVLNQPFDELSRVTNVLAHLATRWTNGWTR
jgi:hypothetical protein